MSRLKVGGGSVKRTSKGQRSRIRIMIEHGRHGGPAGTALFFERGIAFTKVTALNELFSQQCSLWTVRVPPHLPGGPFPPEGRSDARAPIARHLAQERHDQASSIRVYVARREQVPQSDKSGKATTPHEFRSGQTWRLRWRSQCALVRLGLARRLGQRHSQQ